MLEEGWRIEPRMSNLGWLKSIIRRLPGFCPIIAFKKSSLKKKRISERYEKGDSRESNPGPRPPEGRIMPLDHYPRMKTLPK